MRIKILGLSLTVVVALIVLALTHNSASKIVPTVSLSAGPLASAITEVTDIQTQQSSNLFVYFDITESVKQHYLKELYRQKTVPTQVLGGTWKEAADFADGFMNDAPAKSVCEIATTCVLAGVPEFKKSWTIPDGSNDREALIGDLQSTIAAVRAKAEGHRLEVEQTWLLEDVYTLTTRGSLLNTPYQLVVVSDGQQLSNLIKYRDMYVPANQRQKVLAKVLKQLPPPANPPSLITFIYWPGEGPLTGQQEQNLLSFYKELFTAWGAKVKITEPHVVRTDVLKD